MNRPAVRAIRPSPGIYLMDADGGNPSLVADAEPARQEMDPTWKADGSAISFAVATCVQFECVSRTSQIWRVDRDGSNLWLLTSRYDDIDLSQPFWSPLP